ATVPDLFDQAIRADLAAQVVFGNFAGGLGYDVVQIFLSSVVGQKRIDFGAQGKVIRAGLIEELRSLRGVAFERGAEDFLYTFPALGSCLHLCCSFVRLVSKG